MRLTPLLVVFWIYQAACMVQGNNTICITCEFPHECDSIFDDNLTTYKTLYGGDGVFTKTHRLEIKPKCTNTSGDIELRAVLLDHVDCSDLSILFVNHTTGACRRKDRCQESELIQTENITSCLIKCPKLVSKTEAFEVDLIYGFMPNIVNLLDLHLYQGVGVTQTTRHCPENFTGPSCGEFDECASNPCANNGTCVDTNDSYTCSCVLGFSGTKCETNINDCSLNPCQNGGTCNDGINNYTCSCAAGYAGRNCQNNIDECAGVTCQNGGTCNDGINTYNCSCVDGFNGNYCEININDCAGDPCQSGGTCTDGILSYTCTCLPGFTGEDCETNIDDCAGVTCQNGGTCNDGVSNYTCSCAACYDGRNCQYNIDECDSIPCQNGGTCTDRVNSYSCQCRERYEGEHCQTDRLAQPAFNHQGLDPPVYYENFEDTYRMTLHNGSSLVPGKIGQSVFVDATQSQWVDLGNVSSVSCLPRPSTCTSAGATVSLWVKMDSCEEKGAIISSMDEPFREGIAIFHPIDSDFNTRFRINEDVGRFDIDTNLSLGYWTHIVMVYKGPNAGSELYVNGTQKGLTSTQSDPQQILGKSSGRVVIGRRFVTKDEKYCSCAVDELMFWDKNLNNNEVQALYGLY